MPRIIALIPCLLMLPAFAGGRSCFTDAETYYEQLYCEVEAEHGSAGLPDFFDFRKNDEVTQALLLKRPAARLGVSVVIPRAKAPPAYVAARPTPVINAAVPCDFTGPALSCGASTYTLVGNISNNDLAPGALGPDNNMLMPSSPGAGEGEAAFLLRSYQHYLDKMLAIGLGGVTMSYGKFAYLYTDLNAKGVNFAARFETMYRFLKKDKAELGVNTAQADTSELRAADCAALGQEYVVCSRGGRNYVFVGV